MVSDEGNGVPPWVKREHERFDRELQEVRRTHREDIHRLNGELVALRDRLQDTRDTSGEQRGKLAIVVILVSSIMASAITIALNKIG